MHYEQGFIESGQPAAKGGSVMDELAAFKAPEQGSIGSNDKGVKGVGMAESPSDGGGGMAAGFTPAAIRRKSKTAVGYTPSALDRQTQRRITLADEAREAEAKHTPKGTRRPTRAEERAEEDKAEKEDLFMTPEEQLKQLRAGQVMLYECCMCSLPS
jgi:hypothetical protein